MKPRVIGAGLGRTGTASLKIALEKLLDAPCYHMLEVFNHPEHVSAWHEAANGDCTACTEVVGEYGAAVDWPAAAFWPELSAAYPDALVLLSVRDSEAWWDSVNATIFKGAMAGEWDKMPEWSAMVKAVIGTRFTTEIGSRDACIKAFDSHNESVRATAAPERLLVWQASDGWEPICKALDLPVPDEPFPKVNTREEFLNRRLKDVQ